MKFLFRSVTYNATVIYIISAPETNQCEGFNSTWNYLESYHRHVVL
jgi:hypothetical protein